MSSGSWSEVSPWPIVAIHSVMTPDGKILTFGTDQQGQQGSHMIYDLWDPGTGSHTTLSYLQNTNIFCSCCVIDPITDQILIAGGDGSPTGHTNMGVPFVRTFDYHNDRLSLDSAATLNYSHWYATSLTLADGRVLLLGGKNDVGIGVSTPEIYTHGVGWETMPTAASADFAAHWWYPRAWVSSSGEVFGFSTGNDGSNAGALFGITTTGVGSIKNFGHTPFESEKYDPAIMFSQDKILTIDKAGNGWVMDISGAAPTFTRTQGVGSDRAWSSLTNLADGTVLLTGGSVGLGPTGNDGNLATETTNAMIWNPQTGQWVNDASAAIGRFYHSTAILLADGTVLVSGGGAPGPLTNLNSEIYTPGYLLNADGTLRTDRPVITDAPKTLQQGQTFTISLDNADAIQKLELIKFGTTTHSFDAEQRTFDLTFTHLDSHTLLVTLPANVNALTNGYWMLFANNHNGTPSVAASIKISQFGVDTTAPNIAGTNLMLNGTASHVFGSDVYALTTDAGGQTGSVMSDKRIDLTSDFHFSFDVMTSNKTNAADGMAFVLHNDPFGNSAIGLGGGYLGARGLAHGIAIEFDVHQNTAFGDIALDHTDIVATDPRYGVYRLSGQTPFANLGNGQWHNVDVSWDAVNTTLTYSIDGVQAGQLRLSLDQFRGLFGSQNYAYFGFTGATGGLSGAHQVRLDSLSATFESTPPPGTPHPHDGSIFDPSTIGQHVGLAGSAAYQDAQHTLTLTPDAQNQSGSATFTDKIDLTHDFAIAFSMQFGPNQPGDGMTFVLHNDPNGASAIGGSDLGATGLQNGLAIEFDTFSNQRIFTDPNYNHTDIIDTDAAPGTTLTSPANLGNIVDGGWHQVGVTWNSQTHVLQYWVDGRLGGTLSGDIATQYLGGQTTAYVGFTGATGGAHDLQQVRVNAVDAYFANVSSNYANIQDPIALSNHAVLNGSASYDSTQHTFVLTPDAAGQAGSAMLDQRVDLTYDFQLSFNLYLGNTTKGADGMAFVLQSDGRGGNALGANGGNYGAVGISNGLGIAFDTWQNVALGDIAGDHTNFFNTSLPLALGRISDQSAIGSNGNATDGQWHNVLVSWDATDHTLTYWFDGVQKGSLSQDIVAQYQGGSHFAYLGFTGGTGGAHNLQEVHINSLTATLEPGLQPGRPHDGSIFDPSTIGQHVGLAGSAAYQDAQHTLTLTPDAQNQSGSATFTDKIDLTHDFAIAFSMQFGPNQPGDGMTFVLHNDPNGASAIGGSGGYLGAMGLQNGLAIEFDTFSNQRIFTDPNYNHTDIIDTDAAPGTTLTSPANLGNIVDGGWHQVGVTWNSQTHVLQYWVDGRLGGTLSGDIATQYLGGQTTAYVGFTGATGGAHDLQQVRVNAVDAYFANVSSNYANIQDPIALSNHAVLNGSASYDSTQHTFVLTPDAAGQAGSAMLDQRVDLTYDFQLSFNLYLGNTTKGADGMAFVLQSDGRGGNALGANGGNYGAVGISNGLGIAFDTWQNVALGDIAGDHTNFFNTSLPLALGRISDQSAIGSNGNATDGQWHNVLVSWDATDHTLTYWFDGVQKGSLSQDIVAQYQGGSHFAYLGFTGGTGGAHNLQEVHINSLTATLENQSHIIA